MVFSLNNTLQIKKYLKMRKRIEFIDLYDRREFQ